MGVAIWDWADLLDIIGDFFLFGWWPWGGYADRDSDPVYSRRRRKARDDRDIYPKT